MKVTYQEEGHKYFDATGKEYISVTTLISRYKEYFDVQFWSQYKAIERFFLEYKGDDTWVKTKRMVGYKSVNRFFRNYAKPAEKEIVKEFKKEILKDWDVIRDRACLEGNLYHASRELQWKADMYHRIGGNIHFLRPQDLVDFDYHEIPDGVYSELLVYSNELGVAGQADVVVVEKPYFDIGDYKTNKKMEKVSYQNKRTGKYKMMLKPLQKLMDCNFMHYQLQLSLYAFMLELHGLIARDLWIDHVQRKNGVLNPTLVERHPVLYLRDEVKRMLDHYRRKA